MAVIAPRSWHEWLNLKRGGGAFAPTKDAIAHGLSVVFPVFWYVPRVKPQLMGRAIWQSIRGTVRSMSRDCVPDVVVSYWAFPDGDGGLQVARHFGVPSIVIAGGSDVLLLPSEPGRGPAVRDVLRNSSMVTTVSDGLGRAAVDLGVPHERVRTIRQGVNRKIFHAGDKAAARRGLGLASDSKILLWVGRMVPVKNLDLLVDVVKRSIATHPNLQLHLIGDGVSRGDLQRRVASEKLSGAIRFEGPIGHDQLATWYHAADVTVLSSHSEGLPNVLRESLACGTPFVATDVGDVKEVECGALSRLVPAGDLDAFVCALDDVLERRDLMPAEAGSVRTWDECADDYSELFTELRGIRVAA